jgi:hypothetical protein
VTDIQSLMERLMSYGVPMGEACEILAMACAAGAATAPFRKSVGAQRTAKWRETKRHKASQSVTQSAPDDVSQSVTDRHKPSQCDNASLSLERNIDSKKLEKRESKRATLLPDGWRPDAEAWAATVEQLGEATAENELAKFRDHAAEKGRTAKDWPAAWRNWVRRSVDFNRSRSTGPPSAFAKPLTEFQRKQAETHDIRAQLRDAATSLEGGRTLAGCTRRDWCSCFAATQNT